VLYIGLMSGTSLDGIDAVLTDIDSNGKPTILGSHYLSFTESQRNVLNTLCSADEFSAQLLMQQDQDLARLYASCCLKLLEKYNLGADQIHAIGCHGQTIRHQPGPDGFSWQIGDGHLLAELTGITVINDFRRRDIAAGGEGAPLVPAFHQHVFVDPHNPRQVLNLGGIANITVLFQDASDSFGFDLGPANRLCDAWVKQNWGLDYDRGGVLARSGKVIPALLQQWLGMDFFKQPPPKSTGRELFNLATLQALTPEMTTEVSQDVLATLVEFTASSIAQGIQNWGHSDGELFLCGGGAHNTYLVERIQHHLPELKIGKTDTLGIPVDIVEACAFAWLAFRTMNGLSGNLCAATGAAGPRVLGAIHPA